MFDWEDEFIIESYRVPWLIWVQLLVMILLVIVLVFGFGIFALDLSSDNPNRNSSSSSFLGNNRSQGKEPLINGTSSKVHRSESPRKDTGPSTSKVFVEEDSIEMEETSAKDIALYRIFGRADHPCTYLGFAKQAFLKCLGLGYSSESSRVNKHDKRY